MKKNLLDNNAISLFDKVVRRQPERDAILAQSLLEGYQKLSYKELQERTILIKNWLLSKNIKKGDKILLLLPLSTELYITVIALFRIGAIGILYEPKDIFWQLTNTSKAVNPDYVLTTRQLNLSA